MHNIIFTAHQTVDIYLSFERRRADQIRVTFAPGQIKAPLTARWQIVQNLKIKPNLDQNKEIPNQALPYLPLHSLDYCSDSSIRVDYLWPS